MLLSSIAFLHFAFHHHAGEPSRNFVLTRNGAT
jgi:hypothetical protein